ncbi:GNAT family N-acetyltransferase [Flavihumibacter solisilvae]|uniref:N-acetyltransferase domain-containing protein n=1 Tax=Flavihumibacter solisilvae TaxID=1349421 RepID=A0A0C1LLT9_9BACT|nr:GNAT family protein [Flavihumibacter solisilvae]KIC96308.1 hypothetical protein OI18_00665 [Flavihumibacter solisilvae]
MLKPAKPSDFSFFYGLYMHPEINPYLLYEQMSEESFIPIFEDLLHQKVLFVYYSDEQPAGMCKLVPQKHRNAHSFYLGGVAIHPQFSGKGHGLQMMKEILEYAKQQNCRRIELSTAAVNEKALRLYERAGFEREGLLRNYTWFRPENRYIDEILMSWLDKEYFDKL